MKYGLVGERDSNGRVKISMGTEERRNGMVKERKVRVNEKLKIGKKIKSVLFIISLTLLFT